MCIRVRPCELVQHFKSLGFQPENEMDFADYVLDIVVNGLLQRGIARRPWQQPMIDDASVDLVRMQSFDHLVHERYGLSAAFIQFVQKQLTVICGSCEKLFCRLIQPAPTGAI